MDIRTSHIALLLIQSETGWTGWKKMEAPQNSQVIQHPLAEALTEAGVLIELYAVGAS